MASRIEERMAIQEGKQVLSGNTYTGKRAIAARERPGPTLKPYTLDDGTIYDPEAAQLAIRAKHKAEADTLRAAQDFPSMAAARKAAEMLKANAEVWDKDRLAQGWRRVKNYIAKNPEAVEEWAKQKAIEDWTATTVDTAPHASSRLRKAQEEATKTRWGMEDESWAGQAFAREMIPMPKTLADLPAVDPDSRLGLLEREEQAGLDTTSGYGGLGDALSAAAEFNSPQARAGWLYATTMDKLEEAGITLPEGVLPVQLNETLGQLEYLSPTEDGKVRRTLVESEFFRPEDVGGAADLPELFSMVAAGAAALSPYSKAHPLLAEFGADYAGRNLGVITEFLLSNRAISQEELTSALAGTFTDSAVATSLSRISTRGVEWLGNRGAIKTTKDAVEGVAEAQAKEAADLMEGVNRINAGTDAPAFTLETGSLSLRESQVARGREKTLSSKGAEALEATRVTRLESLSRANQNIAAGAGAAPGPTDPMNTLALTSRVNEAGTIEVVAPRRVAPGVTSHQYGFVGDVEAAAVGPGGRMGEAGVQMFLDHNRNVATIENVFSGGNFGGRTFELMERMLEDIPPDFSIRSSGSVTRQGQKMVRRLNDSGWKIEVRPGTQVDEKTGELINLDGGVYEVMARPGEIRAPDAVLKAEYSRAALENDLTEVMDSVPAMEQLTAESQSYLHATIGWSPQKHTSKYSVENKRTSGVNQTVRRIQNRMNESLTNIEASQADHALNAAVRKEADEEGNTFLTGLVAEEVDLGNLINAREAIAGVAERTKDPDMIRLVTDVDNLIKNGQIYTLKGNPIAASTRGNINASIADWRDSKALLDTQVALVNGNQMFAQGPDGTFLNTSLKNMRLILGNNSRYIKHMKPIMDGSPGLQERASDAIHAIYKADVMEKGWTPERHKAFMNRYGDSAQDIMHPEDLAILADVKPPPGGMGRMESILQRRRDRFAEMTERLGTVDINPDNLLGSLQAMQPGRVASFMAAADRLDPRLATQLRKDMATQIRNDLDTGFFATERGLDKLGTAWQLKDWWNADNGARRRTIKSILGDQYEKDMNTMVEAHAIDAQRTRARGYRPESQGDVIRVTRSLLGPLSRPQRQITAGNYVRQRALARRLLRVMSDPAELRLLNEYGRAPARSKAGIAVLTRLGVMEAAGIQDPDNNPQGVLEFFNQIEQDIRAGLEDKEGE